MPDSKTPEKKRPPHLYKPGQSGNPGGKPKKLREFQEALHAQFYDRSMEVMAELLEDPDGKVRVAALRELYDRMFGKPTQAITGEGGNPLFPPVSSQEMNERIAAILARSTKSG